MDRRTIQQMSTRARRVVFAVALLSVLGLPMLHWFNTSFGRVSLVESNGRRIWIVAAEGDAVTLRDVRRDDALICILDGPDVGVRRLTDLYTKVDNDEIWIERERVENPPPGWRREIFRRERWGTVYITCGVEISF